MPRGTPQVRTPIQHVSNSILWVYCAGILRPWKTEISEKTGCLCCILICQGLMISSTKQVNITLNGPAFGFDENVSFKNILSTCSLSFETSSFLLSLELRRSSEFILSFVCTSTVENK